jgi:flagellar hook protein FlgE
MSINSALYVGVSGLTAESDALGVIGDNLANTSTIGFKQSRADFDDVLGSAAGGDQTIGSGVRMARTQQIFAEGSLTNTGVNTDMAISGDGFFVVGGSVGGAPGTYYTRAGQSSLNSQGQLVNPDGLQFQGYASTGSGTYSTTLGPISVSTAALPPKMTTTLNVTANLDSTATAQAGAFDPQNPTTTSNFSTSMQVYDSKGTAHSVDVYFAKNANGSWDYHALASGSDVTGGTAGQNVDIASGTLTFNSSGALQSNTLNAGGTVSFNGATANQPLALNFGTSIAAGGAGTDGITDFGGTSTVSAQSQDGYASGSLSGVTIQSDGTVDGVYTNGQSIGVAQLAVAKFTSNDGLARTGSNLWTATTDSGVAAVGTAGAGGRGSLVTGELEASNVDVSSQMVDLIAHQFSFQADSKTITTADQMLQDVIQMKQ